jgi:predicted Zn-dependent protease
MLKWLCVAVLFTAGVSAQTSTNASLLSAFNEHRYPQAVEMAGSALKSRPTDPWLWTLRGMALVGMGKSTEGLANLDKALSINSRYVPALKAAAQLTYQHRDSRAAAMLNRLLAIEPDEPAAHAMMGVLAFEAHHCADAVVHFEKSAQLVLNSEASATEYASCLLEEHRSADAVALLSQARLRYASSRNLRYDLGLAQSENGQSADALTTLQPTPDDDPGILNLRSSLESAAGNLDAAFADLKRAVEMDPTIERNYLDMALLCLDHDQDQRAADALTVGIQHLPKNAALYAVRGIAYSELSKYDEAEKDFEKAKELEPKGSLGGVGHSVLYVEREQPERALQSLRQQLKKSPEDAALNTLLGDLLMHQGATPSTPEFREAENAVTRALSTEPRNVEALILMGKIDLEKNDLAGAFDALERANKLDPDNRTVLSQMLLTLRKMGRKDDAVNVAQRLKSLLGKDEKLDKDPIRTASAHN